MAATDCLTLFDSLRSPEPSPGAVCFEALPLPGRHGDYVGKDKQGRPLFLLSASSSGSLMPKISLEHMSVEHALRCRLRRPHGVEIEGIFCAIMCGKNDRLLHEYFLRSVGAVALALPWPRTHAEIAQAIASLAELFRWLSLPPRKTVQGIWAELFVIDQGRDPAALLKSWHTSPQELFDFSLGSEGVEVKSTSSGARVHSFSLDQLHPPHDTTVVVASIFAEPSDGGASILDLTESISARARLGHTLTSRMSQIIGASLGTSWAEAVQERFDVQLARKTLQYYATSAIPSVPMPLPNGVSNVHFQSDLSQVAPIELSRLEPSGLFGALG